MWNEEHKFQIWILKTPLKYNTSKPSVYLFFLINIALGYPKIKISPVYKVISDIIQMMI